MRAIVYWKKWQSKWTLVLGILLSFVLLFLLSGCSNDADNDVQESSKSEIGLQETEMQSTEQETEMQSTEQETEIDRTEEKDIVTTEEEEDFVILLSELSTTPQFYPVEVDGMDMEIIAVKDNNGNVRTAFNTCQVCYDSGRGYYKQDGDYLVCQNCGNRFTAEQVEVESGGCNPWPIFPENKTVTEEAITISYDFLNETKQIFANWKVY